MNADPRIGSPLKQLRGWRIRAAFWHVCGHSDLQGAHTFQDAERMCHPRLCQESMTEIKNIKPTQRDVKNEDRPDYVYENKGEDDIMSYYRDDFLAEHSQIARNSGRNEHVLAGK
ncbi:MAG: hypothetical protein ABSF14_09425 [Terriglobia bacterium]|jgi:hypothetical protein